MFPNKPHQQNNYFFPRQSKYGHQMTTNKKQTFLLKMTLSYPNNPKVPHCPSWGTVGRNGAALCWPFLFLLIFFFFFSSSFCFVL